MSSKIVLRCYSGHQIVHLERVPMVGEIIHSSLGSPLLVIQVAQSQERTTVWASKIEEENYRFAYHMYDEEAGVPHQDRLGSSGYGRWEPK